MDVDAMFGNTDQVECKDDADEHCYPYGDLYRCPPSYKTHPDINDILQSATDVSWLRLMYSSIVYSIYIYIIWYYTYIYGNNTTFNKLHLCLCDFEHQGAFETSSTPDSRSAWSHSCTTETNQHGRFVYRDRLLQQGVHDAIWCDSKCIPRGMWRLGGYLVWSYYYIFH